VKHTQQFLLSTNFWCLSLVILTSGVIFSAQLPTHAEKKALVALKKENLANLKKENLANLKKENPANLANLKKENPANLANLKEWSPMSLTNLKGVNLVSIVRKMSPFQPLLWDLQG
jgi:hypothetical protein